MSQYEREKQVFSYMDGVPVKISEQYKPPRKVVLPVGFQHRLPVETITEEYDFKLERSVLAKMGEWRKIRNAAIASRKERIRAEDVAWQDKLTEDVQQFSLGPSGSKCEKKSNVTPGTSCVTYSHPTVSSTPSHNIAYPNSVTIPSCNVAYSTSNSSLNPIPSSCVSYSNPSMDTLPNSVYSDSSSTQQNHQYCLRDSILTPIPISHISNELHTITTSSQFNISDFEADTSSPFDNMELKTINEMEELAHVLQPLSNSPDSNKNKNESPGSGITLSDNYSLPTMPFNTNQTIPHYNTIGFKPDKDPMMLPHLNGLTGYNAYGTAPRTKDRDSRNENYVNLASNQYEYSSNMQQKLGNYGYYPEQSWNINLNVNRSEVVYRPSATGDVKSDVIGNVMSDDQSQHAIKRLEYSPMVNHKSLTYGLSFPSTCNQHSSPNQDQQSSSRSLSKSVPDIVQELEKELTEKRIAETNVAAGRTSHTPPPRPNSFGSTGLENWKPWPDLDSPEQPQTKEKRMLRPSAKTTPASSLPNPYHELNGNTQHLVNYISEMGFSLPRVARACQAMGDDGKKVVEFLLQVQSLEEANWPGDRAEMALLTNNYNYAEAVKHLEAMTQLLDLGFPEDRVCRVLVMFNNDRDKALDHMIS